jgi:serine/threonine-protein kinase
VPPADLLVGTQLLDYRIERLLGRGGMGVVYLAEDVRLRRKVALKLLAADLADDERFRQRFLRECELAAAIDHPHVTPIYRAGETDGVLYIAMRYVPGTDLKALVRREGALDPLRALAIVKQVATALDAAHEHGLVHRDVKPANVLIADQAGSEHAYLSDFGLVKSASASTGLSAAGQFLGTIDYVAPEQIRGEPVDGRADLYSLGCLCFECLTGEVPFRRETDIASIYAQLQADPPPASARRRGLPPELDRVLARALAKKPGARYTTCREFAAAVETALGGSGVVNRRRRRMLLLAGAALATAAVAGSAVVVTHGSGTTRSRNPAAAAVPIRYGVTLSEQLSSGALGATPDLTLFAVLDDGRGRLRGLGSGPPPQTGEITFRLDRRQFEPDRGRSGVSDLLSDPAGTQVGYFTLSPGGEDLVQTPLRKTGVSRDERTGDAVVEFAQGVSPAFRRLAGGPSLPMTLRIGARDLVFTANLQKVARNAVAAGSSFSFSWASLHLFGIHRRFGQEAVLARNPDRPLTLTASVSARPCQQPTCAKLGSARRDSVRVTLPRALTIAAPRRALYGRQVRFHGTADPGTFVTVAYQREPGSGPPCTTANYQRPPDCAPRLRAALLKITERRTRVAADGSWSLMVPLHSSTAIPGPALLPLERSVSGTYVAVEYSGRHIWGPWPGFGSFSIVAPASTETVVALAKPRIALERQGARLRVRVSVAGADRFVRLVLRLRGAVVSSGVTTDRGVFLATIPAPKVRTALEARATSEGAIGSSSALEIAPASG